MITEEIHLEIKKVRKQSQWLPVYTNGITGLGLAVLIIALRDFPADRSGLIVFALSAAIAELSDVELFKSSRSRVSVSSIIALASILAFGPLAGAITHLASGLMTGVTTTLRSQQPEVDRASWVQRSAFNTGMLLVSTALAGWVYVWSGGTVGSVAQVANAFPLLAAATTDVLVNLTLLILVIALQTRRSPVHIWQQDFQWATPIAIVGGLIGGAALAMAYEMFRLLGYVVFMLPILATTYSFRLYVSNMKVYVDQLERTNLALDEANLGLLETLGAVIDAYDVYTYGHSTQVAIYAQAIAEKMHLSLEQQAVIVKGALVHDVGKVGVLDAIVSKQGPLTEEEYNLLKRHTVIGAEIVGRMKGLQSLVPLVRHHHERWDGRGYPDGLAGDEIPLGARIIALADALDAMFSDRPYRPTRTYREAIEEVRRCAGRQFDPQVVAALFAVSQERGSSFFKNSAATVDRVLQTTGRGSPGKDRRHLKKSVLFATERAD